MVAAAGVRVVPGDPVQGSAGRTPERAAAAVRAAAGLAADVQSGLTAAGNPATANGEVVIQYDIGTAPTFSSASSTTFTTGSAGSFSVTTSTRLLPDAFAERVGDAAIGCHLRRQRDRDRDSVGHTRCWLGSAARSPSRPRTLLVPLANPSRLLSIKHRP